MTAPRSIAGVVPVIPIPFEAQESMDREGLAALCDFAVTHRAAAACLPAFASEYYKLSDEERVEAVRIAVSAIRGRIPVIGQANHGSARMAASLAQANQRAGADVISVALPRAFAYSESDLLQFAQAVAHAIEVPLMIQDWNPTGSSVGATFCARLHETCPNFRYIKLEEAEMGAKVRAIHEACGDAVGVLEGWGGAYMLELIPTGIIGIMPGLGLVDVLHRIWGLARQQRMADAYTLFASVHPWLTFTLQSIESLNYLEKALLMRRGVLRVSHVRQPTKTLDRDGGVYADFLLDRMLKVVGSLQEEQDIS